MNRISLLICCILLFVLDAASDPATPILRFSIYAVAQKDSPIRIVDFRYDSDDLQLVLSNQIDTIVRGAVIVGRLTAPTGCTNGDAATTQISGPHLESLRIRPHERLALKPGSSLTISSLVKSAQMQQIAGAQVQVEVTEVDLADGTTWRPSPDPRLPTGRPTAPFNRTLIDADAGMCRSSDAVLRALSNVSGTRSKPETSHIESSNTTVQGEVVPHIVVECKLEGTLATCPAQ